MNRNAIQKIFKEPMSWLLVCIYVVAAVHWLLLAVFNLKETGYNYFTALYVASIPVSTSVFGLFVLFAATKNYVRLSALHKAALCFICFLFLWGFGSCVFIVYNFNLNIPVPFPSLVDLFYFFAGFFLIAAMHYYTSGIQLNKKEGSIGQVVFFILAPIFLMSIVILYAFFMLRFGFVFADVILPAFNIFYLTIDVLMMVFVVQLLFFYFSHNIHDDFVLPTILLITGLSLQYIADILYAFLTSTGVAFAGNYNDFVFVTAFLFFSLFLIQFVRILSKQSV